MGRELATILAWEQRPDATCEQIGELVGCLHGYAHKIKKRMEGGDLDLDTVPTWKPTVTAFELMAERCEMAERDRDRYRRQRDQLLDDCKALVAENRRLERVAEIAERV
jgi:hypothetical protein